MKWKITSAIFCLTLIVPIATSTPTQAYTQFEPDSVHDQNSKTTVYTKEPSLEDPTIDRHGVTWPIFETPRHHFKDITFPMIIKDSPDLRQFFFSNEFQYAEADSTGYFGLQPMQPAKDGHRQVSVRFSSFNENAAPVDTDLCRPGADGDDGVTCASDIPFTPGAQYDLTLTFTKEDHTFRGKVIDTVTHKEYSAGAYRILDETAGISSTDIESWHEDYRRHPQKGKCNSKAFPYYEVLLKRPQATTEDGTKETAVFKDLKLKFQDICPNGDHSSVNPDGTATWRLGFK